MMLVQSRGMIGAETWVKDGSWAAKGLYTLKRRCGGRRAGVLGARAGSVSRLPNALPASTWRSPIATSRPRISQRIGNSSPIPWRSQSVRTSSLSRWLRPLQRDISSVPGDRGTRARGHADQYQPRLEHRRGSPARGLERPASLARRLSMSSKASPTQSALFLSLPNVLLQPHHASGTIETERRWASSSVTISPRISPVKPSHSGALMKAIVIHAARDLRIEDRPVEEPQAGQLRLSLRPAGSAVRICTITITAASARCD